MTDLNGYYDRRLNLVEVKTVEDLPDKCKMILKIIEEKQPVYMAEVKSHVGLPPAKVREKLLTIESTGYLFWDDGKKLGIFKRPGDKIRPFRDGISNSME